MEGITVHGAVKSYKAGCRCDQCRAASREYKRSLPRPAITDDHGTPKNYRAGCRCEQCRASWREYRNGVPSGSVRDDAHGTWTNYAAGCRCDQCRDAESARKRQWYAKPENRAKTDAANRRWVAANPEKVAKIRRRWVDGNPEYFKDYYAEHADEKRAYSRAVSRRRSAEWARVKAELVATMGGACVDCGKTDPRVLEFDHVVPADKTGYVSVIFQKHGDGDVLRAEAAKCVLRCVNCHQVKTLTDGDRHHHRPELSTKPKNQASRKWHAQWFARNKATLLARLGSRCMHCGETDPRVLHFDHIDPNTKAGHVTTLANAYGVDSERVRAEVDKCQLLCGNCHRLRTLGVDRPG